MLQHCSNVACTVQFASNLSQCPACGAVPLSVLPAAAKRQGIPGWFVPVAFLCSLAVWMFFTYPNWVPWNELKLSQGKHFGGESDNIGFQWSRRYRNRFYTANRTRLVIRMSDGRAMISGIGSMDKDGFCRVRPPRSDKLRGAEQTMVANHMWDQYRKGLGPAPTPELIKERSKIPAPPTYATTPADFPLTVWMEREGDDRGTWKRISNDLTIHAEQ